MLEVLLCLSVLVNVTLLLYARWLIKSYSILTEDISKVNELILSFSEHVKSIYGLEMFYGDETLESLMRHGRDLVEKIENLDLLTEDDEDSKEET